MKAGYQRYFSEMNIEEIEKHLHAMDSALNKYPNVMFDCYESAGHKFYLFFTRWFRQKAKEGGVWEAKELILTLLSINMGIDVISNRGIDSISGIFLLNRTGKLLNAKRREIFDLYINDPSSGVEGISHDYGIEVDQLPYFCINSQYLNLLGVICHREKISLLHLIDYESAE